MSRKKINKIFIHSSVPRYLYTAQFQNTKNLQMLSITREMMEERINNWMEREGGKGGRGEGGKEGRGKLKIMICLHHT